MPHKAVTTRQTRLTEKKHQAQARKERKCKEQKVTKTRFFLFFIFLLCQQQCSINSLIHLFILFYLYFVLFVMLFSLFIFMFLNICSGKLKNQTSAELSLKTENRLEYHPTDINENNQNTHRKKSNNVNELNSSNSYHTGTTDPMTGESLTNSETNALQTHPDFLELSEENFFTVFQWCSIPWALARVDGRFCECNESFIRASGFSRVELLSSTIFNLINTSDLQDTFR